MEDNKNNNKIVTDNFADFGSRERTMVIELLEAWKGQGLPKSFSNDGVKPMMNMHSGYVFLTNNDYQVAMMNGDKLELYISTPYEGIEGFLDEITDFHSPENLNSEDVEYIRNVAESEGFDLPANWQPGD